MEEQYSELCSQNAWCNYEAVDDQSIIVEYFVLASLLISSTVIIKYFYKLNNLRKNNQYQHLFGITFVRVYQIVILWLLCSMIKVSINIASYHLFISKDPDSFPESNSGSAIVILSAIFYVFDELCTFLVLGLVIFIPYQWFGFLLQHLSRRQRQNIDIPLESRKIFSKSFILKKFIRGYMFARLVFLVSYFVESGLIVNTTFGCQIPLIDIIFIVTESIFIFIIYCLVFYVAEHTKKLNLIKMKIEDYKRIRTQYCLLILVLLARIILNSLFNGLASQFMEYVPMKNCRDKDQSNSWKRVLFLVLGYSIMHFLPIILIVYIYRPNVGERERDQKIKKFKASECQSKSDADIIEYSSNFHTIEEQKDEQQYQRLS